MVEYYFSNGLRYVKPYYYTYLTNAKGRWLGKTLVQVFADEFHKSVVSIKQDITKGTLGLQLEGQPLSIQDALTEKIQSCHKIFNKVHRHEPPVPGSGLLTQDIVLQNDDKMVVIHKPAGIPTHPTSSYNFNTMTKILEHDLSMPLLYPCNRLDSGTSGLLFCAKRPEFVRLYGEEGCTKDYLAKVDGKWNKDETKLLSHCQVEPIFHINTTNGSIQQHENLPVNSATTVTAIDYDEKTDQTIVKCRTYSGKTHQIRIHLRNMGIPISNDFRYNSKICSPINATANQLELEIYQDIRGILKSQTDIKTLNLTKLDKWDQYQSRIKEIVAMKHQEIERFKLTHSRLCDECGETFIEKDFQNTNTGVYLHYYKYTSKSLNISTCDPDWYQRT